jgi:hypothetical protein
LANLPSDRKSMMATPVNRGYIYCGVADGLQPNISFADL